MSRALKCDRCKDCFDPYEVKDPVYFAAVRQICLYNGAEWANNEAHYRDDQIHLCPTCARIFFDFLKGTDYVPARILDDVREAYADLRAEKEALEYDKKQEFKKELLEELASTPPTQVKNFLCSAIDFALYGFPDPGSRKDGGDGRKSDSDGKTSERKERAKKDSQ